MRCITVAYIMHCCGVSFLHVTCLLHFVLASAWFIFYVLEVKIPHMFLLCIKRSSCEHATYLLLYFRWHSVCLTYVWRTEATTNLRPFFKTGFKKMPQPCEPSDCAAYKVQRHSMLWRCRDIPCKSRYAIC